MKDTSFQKITKAELPKLREMAIDVFRITYKNIISQAQIEYMLKMMYDLEKLEYQIENSHDFYLFKKGQENIGYASITMQNQPTKLDKLYVMPGFQKLGIGEKFLQFLEKLIGPKNEIILNVNKANPAFHFYTKQGFTIKESLILDIGGGFVMDDYILSKKL